MKVFVLALSVVSASFSMGLYGLSENQTAGYLFLVSIDPITGVQTAMGNLTRVEAQAQALATIDDKNGIYYILGYDGLKPNIMGWDVGNGSIVSKAEIPAFATQSIIGLGQGIAWEPDTGSVVAAGQDKSRSWQIGLVNPQTGQFTSKAYVNNTDQKYSPLVGSACAYSTDQRDFIMQIGITNTGASEFLAVSMDGSGKVVHLPVCGETQTADYDLVSQSIYGVGAIEDPFTPGGAMRTLVQVKSDASACTWVGNITGYLIILDGVSAIDIEKRVLYFIAYPCVKEGDPGCIGGGSLDLIGVDLKTGKIVSIAAAFCSLSGAGSCPWSLEFANPIKTVLP